MKKLRLEPNKRVLVVVAHPDDETIWMGGTILKFPDVRWTIFSLCRASDPDRAPKFRRACEIFGARAVMADLADDGRLTAAKAVPLAKKLIIANIGGKKFDYLFTHGRSGEYGHPLHRGVHRAVRELVRDGKIAAQEIYFFHYEQAPAGKRSSMQAQADADYFLPLPRALFMKKKRIQAEIHGYAWDGIDNRLCTTSEAFKVL
jgi:LmbE family N-acetylglucosaminyl deacetylase